MKIQKKYEYTENVCRLTVTVVFGCTLEKGVILPFSKSISENSGSNVQRKFLTILENSAVSLLRLPWK